MIQASLYITGQKGEFILLSSPLNMSNKSKMEHNTYITTMYYVGASIILLLMDNYYYDYFSKLIYTGQKLDLINQSDI